MMGVGYLGKKAMARETDEYMLEHDYFNSRATFNYVYCLRPRRCYTSKRWLFFEIAVRGRRVITGPGDPVIEDRWYHRNEAVIIMLRGL